NYYKLMHLYQGLKQQYPYMSHRALQALMMEQRYALFAEILSIVITNHHICLLCSDESYSKWFSSQSEEYKNILREQKLVSLEHDGMQWQGSIVADLEVIKHHSRMLPD